MGREFKTKKTRQTERKEKLEGSCPFSVSPTVFGRYTEVFIEYFSCYFEGERESVSAGKRAERELTLPDVAMELPSHFPSDYWDRGPGPSSVHPFGVEVSNDEVSIWVHQAGFRRMKRLGVFQLPPGWDASTHSINFVGTHFDTWVPEGGTVRAKCLAQEHNTTSPARTRTRPARSGDEHTNHEAITPQQKSNKKKELIRRAKNWNNHLEILSTDSWLCPGSSTGCCPTLVSHIQCVVLWSPPWVFSNGPIVGGFRWRGLKWK